MARHLFTDNVNNTLNDRGREKMRALVARINVPSVHRYLLMFLSLILGIVTCTMLG